MDDTTRQIWFGLVAPVAIAGAVIAPGCCAGRADDGRDRWALRFPVALGVPVVLAFLMLYGRVVEQWMHGARDLDLGHRTVRTDDCL